MLCLVVCNVQGCEIRNNELDGVLVRGGASPDLLNNSVHDNKGWGINLQVGCC